MGKIQIPRDIRSLLLEIGKGLEHRSHPVLFVQSGLQHRVEGAESGVHSGVGNLERTLVPLTRVLKLVGGSALRHAVNRVVGTHRAVCQLDLGYRQG